MTMREILEEYALIMLGILLVFNIIITLLVKKSIVDGSSNLQFNTSREKYQEIMKRRETILLFAPKLLLILSGVYLFLALLLILSGFLITIVYIILIIILIIIAFGILLAISEMSRGSKK